MKKMISLLLVLVMLLSMTQLTLAATDGQMTEGVNYMELPYDSKDASVYTYTATQTGTLYISVIYLGCDVGDSYYDDNTESMYELSYYTTLTVNGEMLENEYYGTLEVVEGQTYTICWEHIFSKWYQYGWEASLYLSYTDDLIGTMLYPVELNRAQCPTDTIEIAPGMAVYYTLYEFGGSTLTVTGENAYVLMAVNSAEGSDEEPVRYEAENGVVSVPIPYDYFHLQIGNAGDAPATFALHYFFPVGSRENPQELVMGDNLAPSKKDDWEGYNFAFTAICDGTLTLTFPEKDWMASVQNMRVDNWAEWYDPYFGNVLTFEVKAGDVVLINVLAYNAMGIPAGDVVFQAAATYDHHYVDGVCVDCGAKESGEEVPELGSEERPIELYPENCPTETIEVPAGGSVWYVLYEFNYADFLVYGENVYVNATVYNIDTAEQEADHLLPVDGVVTLPVIVWRVWVEICNTGTEPAVFQLDYRYPEGSKKNPAELNMGENTADVKSGNDDGPIYEGYIFEWVARCDGQLTLTMPESDWTLIIENNTTEEEGTWYDSSAGENTIVVDVKKGDELQLSVLNFDEVTGTYIEAEVKFTASVAYDHEYVDGACRHCGEVGVTKLIGDVNGDGKINVRDVRLLMRYIAGLAEESELIMAVADYNDDGKINVRDVRLLMRYIAGLD